MSLAQCFQIEHITYGFDFFFSTILISFLMFPYYKKKSFHLLEINDPFGSEC
jgi:hypothetical protein